MSERVARSGVGMSRSPHVYRKLEPMNHPFSSRSELLMARVRLGCLLASSAMVAFLPPVQAGRVKVWHHHAAAQFEKARLGHTVVSNEGVVRLSRRLKPFAGVE